MFMSDWTWKLPLSSILIQKTKPAETVADGFSQGSFNLAA